MKSCKKCKYSRQLKQLGVDDWYCTYKRDWIGLLIKAVFCTKYLRR